MLCFGINYLFSDHSSIHSEKSAWNKLNKFFHLIPKRWIRKGFTVVNLAVTKNYKIRISKPCKNCANLLNQHDNLITKIIWTTETGLCEESRISEIVNSCQYSTGDLHKLDK